MGAWAGQSVLWVAEATLRRLGLEDGGSGSQEREVWSTLGRQGVSRPENIICLAL